MRQMSGTRSHRPLWRFDATSVMGAISKIFCPSLQKRRVCVIIEARERNALPAGMPTVPASHSLLAALGSSVRQQRGR